MIRVSAMYPNEPGKRFDMDYYVNRHMQVVKEKLGGHGLIQATVSSGLASLQPGAPAAYRAVADMDFESMDAMKQGLAAHSAELMADIPNYTDIQPVMQISELTKI
ncbi:MAG: EthD family reductase [Bryobacteraceae bacterium]|nr:EthD family reductase [Bryobacteraceae bacterium]